MLPTYTPSTNTLGGQLPKTSPTRRDVGPAGGVVLELEVAESADEIGRLARRPSVNVGSCEEVSQAARLAAVEVFEVARYTLPLDDHRVQTDGGERAQLGRELHNLICGERRGPGEKRLVAG